MNRITRIEQGFKRNEIPSFRAGDTVKVYAKVLEGEKERIQVFEGLVIARKGAGHRETMTVRKISFGVGVEKIYPLHAPTIDRIEVIREGKVRRAKLYYIRERSGKSARISEREYAGKAVPEAAVEPTNGKAEALEEETVPAEKS